ncbi:MAG: hypothetical protein JNL74_22800 [Fibrobacteres bacterium]|nr:hypothetical protein [Fibrobacterota bacterium]
MHCNKCRHFNFIGKDSKGIWGSCRYANSIIDGRKKGCFRARSEIEFKVIIKHLSSICFTFALIALNAIKVILITRGRTCRSCRYFVSTNDTVCFCGRKANTHTYHKKAACNMWLVAIEQEEFDIIQRSM